MVQGLPILSIELKATAGVRRAQSFARLSGKEGSLEKKALWKRRLSGKEGEFRQSGGREKRKAMTRSRSWPVFWHSVVLQCSGTVFWA